MGLLADMHHSSLQRVAAARERVPEAALRAAVLGTQAPPRLRLARIGFDIIAEMKDLRSIDVALMSIGGTYTMDPAEAAKAVSIFKPKLAIPMHWGDIIGDKSSADAFTKQSSVPTRILDIGH